MNRIFAPILIAFTFFVMFPSTSFAEQKYFCDIGQFGDGSPGNSKFGLEIQPDRLFKLEDIGKSYARRTEWKKLKASTAEGVTQTLYSSTKEWDHMMVIQGKVKNSLEVHSWHIGFYSSVQAQEEYGVKHYPILHYTNCVSF
jgi:hypothetical protein